MTGGLDESPVLFCSRQSAHSTQVLIRYISRIGSSSIFVVGCPGKVGDGGGMRGENAANRDNTALPESLGGSFEKDGHKNISCFCKIYSWRIFPVTITPGQHDNHSGGSQNVKTLRKNALIQKRIMQLVIEMIH